MALSLQAATNEEGKRLPGDTSDSATENEGPRGEERKKGSNSKWEWRTPARLSHFSVGTPSSDFQGGATGGFGF